MTQTMLSEEDVRNRARVAYDRNWRSWAGGLVEHGTCTPKLNVSLHPPRETDLTSPATLAQAREWTARWRSAENSADVQWEQRSWARVGTQAIPVRITLETAEAIARWAGREQLWSRALNRIADMRCAFGTLWEGDSDVKAAVGAAARSGIGDWCSLEDDDWHRALKVWEWLLSHPGESLYARQLPIHGIDTKWVERNGKALRGLYRALTGSDFAFAQPPKLFRLKACCPQTRLGGCDEYALDARQLAAIDLRPEVLIICENLVNTLCLHDLDGALAIHGSGFAVRELRAIEWLALTPILYWGDLDTNGFAILNALRAFAPHARSILMDEATLCRHLDLCVEEPTPATGALERLTGNESNALRMLCQGDPERGIAYLRLEQERIEWNWAYEHIKRACAGQRLQHLS